MKVQDVNRNCRILKSDFFRDGKKGFLRSVEELEIGDRTIHPHCDDWTVVEEITDEEAQGILAIHELEGPVTNGELLVFLIEPEILGLYWHKCDFYIVRLTPKS